MACANSNAAEAMEFCSTHLGGIPGPELGLLDSGDAILSWVTSKAVCDLQFDGSGKACAYVSARGQPHEMSCEFNPTDPADCAAVVEVLRRVLQ